MSEGETKILKDCELSARQALEMAQGRGGDQAAVKRLNNFEFFGGISSKGVEKRTKVKTRVIAAALKELINGEATAFLSWGTNTVTLTVSALP